MDESRYPSSLQSVLEDFRNCDSVETKMQLLIEYAEQFHPPDAAVAARPYPASHKVPACESEAYLFTAATSTTGGQPALQFKFAVENPQGISAKALGAILESTLSGEPLEQVVAISEDLVYEFFGQSISMGKGLGLMGMVQMARAEARKAMELAT